MTKDTTIEPCVDSAHALQFAWCKLVHHYHHHHHHHHQSLKTAKVVEAPQMILQPVFSIFPVLHCPLGLAELKACPFPNVVFPPLPLSALSSSPFTVPYKMILARPEERETWPYHPSLRLFTIVRRFSCGLIACWILAWTSSLVTLSLYEMCSILR